MADKSSRTAYRNAEGAEIAGMAKLSVPIELHTDTGKTLCLHNVKNVICRIFF